MRKSMDRTGRGVVCAPASLALSAALTPAAAAPAPGESARIPFGERFHVTRHGGIARAANSAITCGRSASRAAASCAAARHGGAGTNGRYRMTYLDVDEPLRRLALWDGFERPGRARRALSLRMQELRIPAHSHGRVGVVAYDGDRGTGKEQLLVRADGRHPYALRDGTNPSRDVMNSTITEFGRDSVRKPAYRNTLGLDSDVFDLSPALRSGADRLNFRFTARDPGYLLGAFFVQADTRR
ncbi:hypothetical protein [Streptomyces lydicus]|uniref:hypothetical protein n=1 Tax=Streptomyces lydicus TaxID=47763 RepID=UPI0036E70FF7